MASINFTIPDAQINRVINALCTKYGYQDNIITNTDPPEISPNPESKAQFSKRMISEVIRSLVLDVEKQSAIDAVPKVDVT